MSLQVERHLARVLMNNYTLLLAATPGFHLQVHLQGKKIIDLPWGEAYPIYDLASLTKLIFTASQYMKLVDTKKVSLDDSVSGWWPKFPHKKIFLHELMSHTAGLPWWEPFYKTLRGPRLATTRWAQLEKKLLKVKRGRVKKAVYSDLDLFVLGAVACRVTEKTLAQQWQALKQNPIFQALHFNIEDNLAQRVDVYAPTEKCLWRKRTMQGEVHDENAWALGGIAPHAGLFGRAADVSTWGLALRESWLGERASLASQETTQLFTNRAISKKIGDWGYLFMKPTKGKASCGKYFSLDSFGHTGFTGTSLWYDPKQDLLVVLLSNRVHPTRDNGTFLQVRPLIHDWVVEAIQENQK